MVAWLFLLHNVVESKRALFAGLSRKHQVQLTPAFLSENVSVEQFRYAVCLYRAIDEILAKKRETRSNIKHLGAEMAALHCSLTAPANMPSSSLNFTVKNNNGIRTESHIQPMGKESKNLQELQDSYNALKNNPKQLNA